MSSFNSSFFKKSYQKSIVQANRSLCIALVFGITGLLFFFTALGAVYFAHKKENFTTISDNIDSVSKNIESVSKNIESVSKNIESAIQKLDDLSNPENSKGLDDIKNDLNTIDLNAIDLNTIKGKLNTLNRDVNRELTGLNRNFTIRNFIIVSLVGGSFIELIAVINFYQYGKAVRQISDRLDRNQRFILANSICEEFEGERKQEARYELMKKIIADAKFANQDNQSANPTDNDRSQSAKTTNHDRDNSNGGKKSDTVPQK